ncbi:hypothetical protein ACHHYP_04341 [Achlya hypogyna]|uniref:Uncharacterized protein n=1 Tax=Achlya hypogyna TaxID=1202772 RepID=A0A1V9Z1D8_ACHHY|nr:hypothetical protein ACHHYP_04341 [Achlya hypogyna]
MAAQGGPPVALSPRETTLFGTPLLQNATVLPDLDANASPRRRPLTQRITFQSIGQMTEQQQQQAAIVQASIDDLWNACVNPTAAYSIDLAAYTQLHQVLSRFCGAAAPTPGRIHDDWTSDAQQRTMITLDRFSALCRQLGDLWSEKLHLSNTATFLSTLVHEVVDYDARCLRPVDRVHTSSTATTFRALLAMRASEGYWDMDSSLAAVLDLDMTLPKTRFQTTEYVFDQLNAMGATDPEWTALRPATLAWLTTHHFEKHHDDIQALILRLNVRFDVSPLMQLRLEPLEDRSRTLTLQALMLLDEEPLVHTIEWLRSLSTEIWRVFASPLGLAALATPEQVAKYFVRLAHFTLSASLYRFLSTLGILEKQELLLYLHTLSATQYSHFIEGIQHPGRGYATAAGVRFMLSFYYMLSTNARLTLLQELKHMQPGADVPRTRRASNHKLAGDVPQFPPLPHKRKVPKPGLIPLKAGSPSKPIKATSTPKPTASIADYSKNTAWQSSLSQPKVVLMNGGVYRPTTTMLPRAKPIDPDRRQLELAYFVTPHVTVQELAFPFPEHCKRDKAVPLDAVGFSRTWVHRAARAKDES